MKEAKPPIVNEQCVVYNFQCDLCDAGYVGYTGGHLHNRVKGPKQQPITDLNNSPPPLPYINVVPRSHSVLHWPWEIWVRD